MNASMNRSDTNEELAVELFLDWEAWPDEPIPFSPLQYSDEPWRSHAIEAWILGNKIEAIDFEQYALSQFILNCGIADVDVWERIENFLPASSSLRRFANHWIAWNHSLSAGVSEYSQLETAKLSNMATTDTRDPRTYDLDHWYSPCGDDINSKCEHEPMVKQAAWDAMNREREPKPSEWGCEWEMQHSSSKRINFGKFGMSGTQAGMTKNSKSTKSPSGQSRLHLVQRTNQNTGSWS